MPEQVRFPYGDAFIFNTPQTDRLSNQLYQEQRQRELYKQQQDKALDDNFSKELVNIKKADIPEVVQSWNDFKQAHINLQRKGRNATPDDQYNVLQKKADVYQKINGSIEHKAFLKQQSEAIKNDKKGLYADDATGKITTMLNTPTSQVDRSKDSELLYPYSMPDLNKELDIARGKGSEKEVTVKSEPSKTDPYKDEIHTLKVGNNPNQFYNSLGQSTVSSNKKKSFVGIENNKYDVQQLQDLEDRYNAKIHDPAFIAAYGETKPFEGTDTELGNALKIATMEEYANKELKPKITYSVNQGRKTNEQQQFALKKMGYNDQLIRGRMKLAQGYKEALSDYKSSKDEQEQNGILNKFIDNSYNAGTDKIVNTEGVSKDIKGVDIDGRRYEGKFIDVPKDIKKEYAQYRGKDAKGEDVWDYPNGFYLTNDKKTLIPLYLGSETQTGGNYLKSDSKPVDIQQYKLPLSKLLLTKKSTGSEVVDDFSGDEQGGYTPKIKTTTTEMNKETKSVHNYSRDQYKSAGWTDEQINKALKAGKIKVK